MERLYAERKYQRSFPKQTLPPGHSYGDAPGYGVWNLNVKHSLTGFQHLGLDFGMGLDNIFNKRDTVLTV